ncbi:hypothetical protein SH449x_002894 [Pirellulaceae bacterium SH449]
MSEQIRNSCPQTQQQVIDTYFMEHRAKLLDIAAYLDRIDRGSGENPNDFRDVAFRKALSILSSPEPHRAKKILELFSDYSEEIPKSAHGMKGAMGAVRQIAGGDQ